MSKRIDALSSLKTVACLSIFLSHTGMNIFRGTGRWGVSVFFVLSGFLMTYGYYGQGRIKDISFSECVKFSRMKIRRLYPLYLITTCAMLPFLFVGDETVSFPHVSVLTGLDVFLVQEWLPLENSSINRVAWYFCVCAFLYCIFPGVLSYMENRYSIRKAWRSILVLLCAQILIGIAGKSIPTPTYVIGGWWDPDFTMWLVYYCPIVRAIDFLLGCDLGYLFINQKNALGDNDARKYSICELLVTGG